MGYKRKTKRVKAEAQGCGSSNRRKPPFADTETATRESSRFGSGESGGVGL